MRRHRKTLTYLLTYIPRTKTKYGDRASSMTGPSVRNAIRECARNEPSVDTFKRSLKDLLRLMRFFKFYIFYVFETL